MPPIRRAIVSGMVYPIYAVTIATACHVLHELRAKKPTTKKPHHIMIAVVFVSSFLAF